MKPLKESPVCFIKNECLGEDQWLTTLLFVKPIPWTQRPFRERSDGFSLSWPFNKSDPHRYNRHICTDGSLKANQGTNTVNIPSRWDQSSDQSALWSYLERWKRAKRDCWLTSVVCSESVHTKRESMGKHRTHTCRPRQSQKDSCQPQLSLKYSLLEQGVNKFVSYLGLPSPWHQDSALCIFNMFLYVYYITTFLNGKE